jgi:hypothetical protein
MTRFRSRVALDAGVLAIALALLGAWLGGRTAVLGVVAGAALALIDFWWLSARVDAATHDAPRVAVWVAAAGLRLTGVTAAVALLFLTREFHPLALVAGLAVLPCALVVRGLSVAREGAS